MKALKRERRKLYRIAAPIENKIRTLYRQIQKEDCKEIIIGRHGVKTEKIKIGDVDLLKLVKRVTNLEEYQRKLYNSCLGVLDKVYERLEKKLDAALKKKSKIASRQ